MKYRAPLILLFFFCIVSNAAPLSQGVKEELARLDAILNESEFYMRAHRQKIENISEALMSGDMDDRHRYGHYKDLYGVCVTYNFDKAMDAAENMCRLSESIGDSGLLADASINRAMLLTTSGIFLDAIQVIEQCIDTTSLNRSQLISYYDLIQRFCQDYSEYSHSAQVRESLKARAGYYRGRVIDNAPKDSWLRRNTIIMDHLNNGLTAEARDSCLALISDLDCNSHEYAITTYYAANACQILGLDDEAVHWFIESAICDVKNAVKDNASLCCLAMELFEREEVDRAFRYIQISMDDAQFYNSKVRPWQIARSLPAIEKAYNDAQVRHNRFAWVTVVVVSVLATLLLVVLVFMILQYVRNNRYSKQLADLNIRLQTALSDLSEANAAKEEYLGLFLSMCSNYLGKLKKIYTMEQMDAELRNFYSTFDNAFIQLYPNFVEKFNALLKPEFRIELKKGEVLNTELRIFALIKLGITQSSHIASLLRYSVNTIYNYRAQIKNSALENRENFEELVKKL